MNIIHHGEEFEPRELIKKSEAGESVVQLNEQDYNTFLSAGSEMHTFTGTASGEHRVKEALAKAVSTEVCDGVLKQCEAMMIILSISPDASSSLKAGELSQLTDFIQQLPENCNVTWGTLVDHAINGELKVTILAILP